MAEEEEVIWSPWSDEENEFISTCFRAAVLSGIIDEEEGFKHHRLIDFIDNMERLDLMGGRTRDQAILTIGLWVGRYEGNMETGKWKPRYDYPDDDTEQLKIACEEMLDKLENCEDKEELLIALARLTAVIQLLHPDNVM